MKPEDEDPDIWRSRSCGAYKWNGIPFHSQKSDRKQKNYNEYVSCTPVYVKKVQEKVKDIKPLRQEPIKLKLIRIPKQFSGWECLETIISLFKFYNAHGYEIIVNLEKKEIAFRRDYAPDEIIS